MTALEAAFAEHLNHCQQTLTHHHSALRALRRQHLAHPDRFLPLLTGALSRFLIEPRRSKPTDRLATFWVQYALHAPPGAAAPAPLPGAPDGAAFPASVIHHLLQYANAKDRAVRFRVCQLVGGIINALPEDAEISAEIFDAVLDVMLVRIADKAPVVRQHAAHALLRLQNPADKTDAVITALRGVLTRDSSKDVRRAALRCISITADTLPDVLSRARDVADAVRKALYQDLAEKVGMKVFTISQRILLLEAGLKDRVPSVVEACTAMLRTWLADIGDDPVKLLESLDIETDNHEAVAELAIKALLADGARLAPPAAELPATPEAAMYLRLHCAHIDADAREQLLPTITAFCEDLLQPALADSRDESPVIARHLVAVAHHLNFHDEAGRRTLADLLMAQLETRDLDRSLFKPVFVLLGKALPGVDRMARLVELIRTVEASLGAEAEDVDQQRLALEERIAALSANLDDTEARKVTASLEEDTEAVARFANQIEAIRGDLDEYRARLDGIVDNIDPIWSHCLDLVILALEHNRGNSKIESADLDHLIVPLVFRGFQRASVVIREQSAHALGLHALNDRDAARHSLQLFMQAIANDDDLVRARAMQVVFDLLALYGLAALDPDFHQHNTSDSAESTSAYPCEPVVTLLLEHLADEAQEMREIAAEGFCKLLFLNVLGSSQVLSRLLLLYFNPTSDDEESRLQQVLSVFFPAFVFAPTNNAGHQRLLEEAFLPTLRVVLHAPRSSPMSKVNPITLGQYMIYLTACDGGSDAHTRIANQLLNEILSHPKSIEAKPLCRIASFLVFDLDNRSAVGALAPLCESLLEVMRDTPSRRYIRKLLAQATAALEGPAVDSEEDAREEQANDAAGSDEEDDASDDAASDDDQDDGESDDDADDDEAKENEPVPQSNANVAATPTRVPQKGGRTSRAARAAAKARA